MCAGPRGRFVILVLLRASDTCQIALGVVVSGRSLAFKSQAPSRGRWPRKIAST